MTKIRILCLTTASGINQGVTNSYNGGGWGPSLQKLLESESEIELALAFPSKSKLPHSKNGNTNYYPIYTPEKSKLQKIKLYYGGYRYVYKERYITEIQSVVKEFKPDLIHLFGLENPFAAILGKTNVPIIVHLQGILNSCQNAFWPQGLNKVSLLWPLSKSEWIIRNGYRYAYNSIVARAKYEIELFKKVKYVMGRTRWDYDISRLYSPNSKYFHVDEVLRNEFYENAGSWNRNNKELIITSTISETIYKGFDIILKTAKILTDEKINFHWNIIGVRPNTEFVRFFEGNYHIKCKNVNIKCMGVLSSSDIIKNLHNTAIFVHPSYIDNSPNALCEAQLLGVPVIATYVGGIPSLIDNAKNGYLVPANDPYSISYLIQNLNADRALADKISIEGYKTASVRHNRDKILCDILSTYKKVVSNSY